MAVIYYVYILECADGSLYTGITSNVPRRYEQHRLGKGGHYTRSHPVKRLRYTERKRTKAAALKREYRIKQLSRAEKILLCQA